MITATQDRPAATTPREHRLPRVPAPRRPGLVAAGTVLVMVCGFATSALVADRDGELVLVAARDIPAGQPISGELLRPVRLADSPVRGLAPTALPQLAGTVAAVLIPAGTPITARLLLAGEAPPGQLVTVALRAEARPIGLHPGDLVDVRAVPARGGTAPFAATPGELLAAAVPVVATEADDTGGLLRVALRVPERAVPRLVAGAALDAVVLVVIRQAP